MDKYISSKLTRVVVGADKHSNEKETQCGIEKLHMFTLKMSDTG